MTPTRSSCKNGRRSSILKPPKMQSRPALQEMDFNNPSSSESSPTNRQKRRVSFAEKKHVKEFCDLKEEGTLWDNTYEESEPSNTKAIHRTDCNDMPSYNTCKDKDNASIVPEPYGILSDSENREDDHIYHVHNYSVMDTGKHSNLDSNSPGVSQTAKISNEGIDFAECIGYKQTASNDRASWANVYEGSDLDLTEDIGGVERTKNMQIKPPNYNERLAEMYFDSNMDQECVEMAEKYFKTCKLDVVSSCNNEFQFGEEPQLESVSKASPAVAGTRSNKTYLAMQDKSEVFENTLMELSAVNTEHQGSSWGIAVNSDNTGCTVRGETEIFMNSSMEFTTIVTRPISERTEIYDDSYIELTEQVSKSTSHTDLQLNQTSCDTQDETKVFIDSSMELTTFAPRLLSSNENNLFINDGHPEVRSSYELATENVEGDKYNVSCRTSTSPTDDFPKIILANEQETSLFSNYEQKSTLTSNLDSIGLINNNQYVNERDASVNYVRETNDDNEMECTEGHTIELFEECIPNEMRKTVIQESSSRLDSTDRTCPTLSDNTFNTQCIVGERFDESVKVFAGETNEYGMDKCISYRSVPVTTSDLTESVGRKQSVTERKGNQTYTIRQYDKMIPGGKAIGSDELYANVTNDVVTNDTLPKTLSIIGSDSTEKFQLHHDSTMTYVKEAHIDGKANSEIHLIESNEMNKPAKNNVITTSDKDEEAINIIAMGETATTAMTAGIVHRTIQKNPTPMYNNMNNESKCFSSKYPDDCKSSHKLLDPSARCYNDHKVNHEINNTCTSHESERLSLENAQVSASEASDYTSEHNSILNLSSELYPEIREIEQLFDNEGQFVSRSECRVRDHYSEYKSLSGTPDQKDEDHPFDRQYECKKVEIDSFSIMTESIEKFAKSDKCIWKIRCLDREKFSVDFISKSLLVVMTLSATEEDGTVHAIKRIQIVSLLIDEAEELITTIHYLITSNLNPEELIQSYNKIGDILPLMEVISQQVRLAVDFMNQFIHLQKYNMVDIHSHRVSFIVHTSRARIILRVAIHLKPSFCEIGPNDVTVECIVGSLRVDDIKQMIASVNKDHRFLQIYMDYIEDYIASVEK